MKLGKNLNRAIGDAVAGDDKKKNKPADGVKFTDAEKAAAKAKAASAPVKEKAYSMQDVIDADRSRLTRTPNSGATFTDAEKKEKRLAADIDTQDKGSVPTSANRKAKNLMRPQSSLNN